MYDRLILAAALSAFIVFLGHCATSFDQLVGNLALIEQHTRYLPPPPYTMPAPRADVLLAPPQKKGNK